MFRRLILQLLCALLPCFLLAQEKQIDPESLVGKTVDAALETLGLEWEQVGLQDEPPGVFRKIYISEKAAAKLIKGSNGKAVYLVPTQKQRYFLESRKWDRKIIGKMSVGRVDIGAK